MGGMWKGGCKATKLGTGIAACTKLGRNFDAFANAHSPPPTPFQPFRAILVISPVPANAKQQPMQKIAVVQLAEAFKLPSKSFVAPQLSCHPHNSSGKPKVSLLRSTEVTLTIPHART